MGLVRRVDLDGERPRVELVLTTGWCPFAANLYASIAATINFVVRAPRQFAEDLGKLLFWCGELTGPGGRIAA